MSTEDRASLAPAEAAKAVKREVVVDGQPILQAIRPDEVLATAARDGVVTVVTTSGEKLTGKLPATKK